MQWTHLNLKSWYNLLTMEGSTSLKASMVLKLNMLCHYQLILYHTIILQNIVKMIQPVMSCSATRALPPEVFSL